MIENFEPEMLIKALVALVAGWLITRITKRAIMRIPDHNVTVHGRTMLDQASTFIILTVFVFMAINQLGFDMTALLGAAGILSVAVGFASQTSASNLISGLFLLGERAFTVGDVIKVGDQTGEVLSIDLLSVKLRTFDNLFVRIPNENLMKSTVTTLTRFPIRRFDMKIGIAYHEDIRKARDVLIKVARNFHLCLDEPAPLIIMQGFGESSIDIQFSVWGARERFLDMRNGLQERVKEAFDENGIEIPFPHRTIYAGSKSTPHPVKILKDQDVN